MFTAIGKLAYRHGWKVLLAGVIFIVACSVYGTSAFGQLKGGGFEDADSEAYKAAQAIHTDLGHDEATLVVLFTSHDGTTADQPAYRKAVEATLAKLDNLPGKGAVTTYYSSGGAPQLISKDKFSTYAVVGMQGDGDTRAKNLKLWRPQLTSPTLQVRLGGEVAITEEISTQVAHDLSFAEEVTFPLVGVLLAVIMGSLIAGFLPLAVGGITILGAFLLVRVAQNFTDTSVFSISLITMLGLGLAIDYSLFVVNRFREELKRQNGNVEAAIIKTTQTAGRTVVFSGLTVTISLLSLLVFPQMFLRSMGLGGAAAVLVAMTTAVTLLPALLGKLGTKVNALPLTMLIPRRFRSSKVKQPNSGFWYNTSQFVMRHPGLVLICSLIPLLWLGSPFLQVNFSTPDSRSLPKDRESRVVSDLLTSEFPRNETKPIQIVVQSATPALEATSLTALYDYTRQIQALPGVRRIDSLVTLDPKLDKAAYTGFYSEGSLKQNPQAAAAAQRFARNNYSLATVLYDSDPLGSDSQNLVRSIRALPVPAGLSIQVTGDTAYLVDFLSSIANHIPLALGIIVGVIFVLLFLMLGSLVVPVKAVILNILSMSVSFGALVWIFQEGHFADWLNFTPLGSIDGTQPVLIFAIAFGLSMDYEVFLLSRIKEHYDRTGDMTASVAEGVQKTGGIITSAALLLVIVMCGFASGEVVFIKQVGVGLALAVLVDATIVRLLLVPASMRLMGKYNWWAPAPLAALYRWMGLSEVEPVEAIEAPADIETADEVEAEPAVVGSAA